jgi:hypothetical protein
VSELLLACVRSFPSAALGRPQQGAAIAAALAAALEASAPPATAAVAKRVLFSVALRAGLSHVDAAAFKVGT